MGSVRARVTILGVVVVAVSLTVGGLLLRVSMQRQLTSNGDELSIARAQELAQQVGSLPQVVAAGEEGVAQVVADDGTVLAASGNIAGRPAIAGFRPEGGQPAVRTLDAPDDTETETYRLWAVDADGATVYVGRSLESVEEALAALRTALLVGLPLLGALLAGALWLLVGRALRPVEVLRAEVASISPRELDRRVAVPATYDEVSRLADTMNAMLIRLEEAAAREREFVGNASHELLGPVAACRTQLEVALTYLPPSAQWERLGQDLLEDALRMERLVRDLLFLARADADELALRSEPVDLADVVAELASPQVTVEGEPTLVVGDRAALATLIRNLLDNAGRHARSRVLVTLRPDGLVVADDGPGVPSHLRDRIFDRFFQADPTRSPGSAGAGLGLAIARSIAQTHGGTLDLDTTSRLGGASFVLRLPPDRTLVPTRTAHGPTPSRH